MKKNKNYLDRIVNTEYFAHVTCFTVNREKEVPFWTGCTDLEKYSKDYARERPVMYRRHMERRRELKAFVDRVMNDPLFRAELEYNLNLVNYAREVSSDRNEFYEIVGLPMPTR